MKSLSFPVGAAAQLSSREKNKKATGRLKACRLLSFLVSL
jgi:hypothetical protein